MKNIIFFTLGALISGFVVWYITNSSHQRAHDYFYDISTNANLEYYIKLQKAPELQVKCHIAKMAVITAKELKRKIEQNTYRDKLVGFRSLSAFTYDTISSTLSEYQTKQIDKYADTCVTDTRLYE